MAERSSVRIGDEILEFKSLNLRELMRENDEDEIREDAAEDDSANRRRQTMGSILVGDGGKTLRDAIQSDGSKAWEPPRKCRKIAGSRLLKNVFRAKKKYEEEEGDESANLLSAERSPSVVDSVRLRAAGDHGGAAIRVFLVGRSPSHAMDEAAENERVPWRFLKRKLRLRNIVCCGSSWSAATEQSNSNSAVPVVLPPAEEPDDAISWNNSSSLQEPGENINGASETEGNANRSRGGSCVNAEEPANLADTNSAAVRDLPAGGGRQLTSSPFESNVEESEGSMQTGMNLAAALAAERQLRAAQDRGSVGSAARNAAVVASDASAVSGGSPFRVSLMSLLEEADGRSGRVANGRSKRATDSPLLTDGSEEAEAQPAEGVDPLCCVCMVRRKGAAFIPCGHTFCRFCSRELWVTRGLCPLCNTYVMEILDIF